MNIDLLSKMVKELILDNDVVALPGLGSFVAEMVPATFSDRGYTINPPYRKLYFRENIDQDDLLVNCYAASNGVSAEVAKEVIGEYMGELKDLLNTQKSVVFPELGKLRATRENNYFFVPFEDTDIYPEGLGLEPISLKAHNDEPAEEAVAAAESAAPVAVAAAASVASAVVGDATVVEAEPTAEPVVEEVAELVAEEPVAEEAMEEPVAEPVAELPAVETVEPAPMAIEIAEDWVVPEFVELASQENETSASEEVAEPTEPVVEPAEEPVKEEVAEPAAEEPVAEEVVEPAAEEPVAEEVAEPVAEEPAKENAETAEPAVKALNETPAKQSEKKSMPKALKVTLIVLACLVGLAIIALGLFILLSHIAPDFIDSLLYTKEELNIISGVN